MSIPRSSGHLPAFYNHKPSARRGYLLDDVSPLYAFAYALAHYFSLLVYQGQAIVYLASDPLGNGSDIFGTASHGALYRRLNYWIVEKSAAMRSPTVPLVMPCLARMTSARCSTPAISPVCNNTIGW